MTEYYKITLNDSMPISFEEYKTLPEKDKHIRVNVEEGKLEEVK